MAISMAITRNDTGAQFPAAYGRIDDVKIDLTGQTVRGTLNWYATSTTAANGKQAVTSDPIDIPFATVIAPNPTMVASLLAQLQAGAISTPLDALKAALYVLLKQETQYSGALDAQPLLSTFSIFAADVISESEAAAHT